MAHSQNGYPVLSSSQVESYKVPGTSETVRLRPGAVADVLLYVARRFNAEVESLAGKPTDEWGWAVRDIRGASVISNHASGTAIDLNAAEHPLGVSPSKTFSSKQIARIHAILRDCDGVVRWGGDYSGRKDSMHFEINADLARVDALARKITAPPTPTPTPPPPKKVLHRMFWLASTEGKSAVFLCDGISRRWVTSARQLASIQERLQHFNLSDDVAAYNAGELASGIAGVLVGPDAPAGTY